MVKNQHSVLLQSFQQSRDAVSGVSLDEEMTNLIQFQHAYQGKMLNLYPLVDELLGCSSKRIEKIGGKNR